MGLFGRKKIVKIDEVEYPIISDLEMARYLIPAIEWTRRCRSILSFMMDNPRYVEGMLEANVRSPLMMSILVDAIQVFNDHHAAADAAIYAAFQFDIDESSAFRPMQESTLMLCVYASEAMRHNRDMILASFHKNNREASKNQRSMNNSIALARSQAKAIAGLLFLARRRQAWTPAQRLLEDNPSLPVLIGLYFGD